LKEDVSLQTKARKAVMTSEREVWQKVGGEWRPLYGGIETSGLSIEYHRFSSPREVAWHESFHPETLEVCLNLEGRGVLENLSGTRVLMPRMVAFYIPDTEGLRATRQAGEEHCFLTVEITRAYLQELLGTDSRLQPWLENFLSDEASSKVSAELEPMPPALQRTFDEWLHPPVAKPAQDCWFRARVLDLAALFFFAPEEDAELFCSRQKKVARERMEKVKQALEADPAEPPRVEEIARQIGCSASYLSRIFAAEAGMTIPQYLRQLRLEKAAGLLRAGTHNVTEAAFEVGYNSLSHFSKAFWEMYGCCPGLYPQGMAVFHAGRGARTHK